MRLEDVSKEIITGIVLIFMIVAFIPLFQELGVNYSFMGILIFAVILSIVVAIIIWVKQTFFD